MRHLSRRHGPLFHDVPLRRDDQTRWKVRFPCQRISPLEEMIRLIKEEDQGCLSLFPFQRISPFEEDDQVDTGRRPEGLSLEGTENRVSICPLQRG